MRIQDLLSEDQAKTALESLVSEAWELADSFQLSKASSLFERFPGDQKCDHFFREYARFLYTFDSPQSALAQLEVVLAGRRTSISDTNECHLFNEAAKYARESGDSIVAKQYQQLAVKLDLAGSHDGVLQPQTLLGQACDFMYFKEYSAAKYLLTSLCHGKNRLEKKAKLTLAELYFNEGEHVAAVHLANETILDCNSETEMQLRVKSLRILGQVASRESHFTKAKIYLKEALESSLNSARCQKELPHIQDALRHLNNTMKVLCQFPELN